MTAVDDAVLFHFSHDPDIAEFVPHTAATAQLATPYVWTIDAAHAPAYWFPRDCPRITFWPPDEPNTAVEPSARALLCGSPRVHAIEWAWLRRIRDAVLYRYEFDPAPFAPLDRTAGYHVARRPVRPLRVRPVGDLLAAHERAGIELRLTGDLWPLADAVRDSGLDFSMIRMRNAGPRG